MSQKLVVKSYPIISKKRNIGMMKRLAEACLTNYDYKIVFNLIISGNYEIEDDNYDMEPLVNRLSKVINNLEFIERLNEQ